MDDATLKKILPTADSKFFVKKGQGTVGHNLASALHLHSLSNSNPLHAIKEETGLIEKVFENDLVKRQIRGGGLDEGMQTLLLKKIIREKPDLMRNELKKNIIKKIIKHFGKNKGAIVASQYGTPNAQQSKGITSINKPGLAKTSASSLKPKTSYINHPTEENTHVSISRKINSNRFNQSSVTPSRPASRPKPLSSNFSLVK